MHPGTAVSVRVGVRRSALLSSVSRAALLALSAAVGLGVTLPSEARAGAVVVNPVQASTYTLTASNNPITFGTGTNVNTASLTAVYGSAAANWTITNQGSLQGGVFGLLTESPSTVTNAGSIGGSGSPVVEMVGGGSLTNETGGTISGLVYLNGVATNTVDNQSGATISGGVSVSQGTGSVTNAGSIGALNVNQFGVGMVLSGGGTGTVTNLSGGIIGGGISIYGGSGSVTNAGTITGPGKYGLGVVMWKGGNVTNTGMISGTQVGVWIFGGSGMVDNSNNISATGTDGHGVELGAGGTVTNHAGGTISSGPGAGSGVFIIGAGTVPTRPAGQSAAPAMGSPSAA